MLRLWVGEALVAQLCPAQGRVAVGKETQNSVSVRALIPEDFEVLSVRVLSRGG